MFLKVCALDGGLNDEGLAIGQPGPGFAVQGAMHAVVGAEESNPVQANDFQEVG